jgi:hypothetical protein
MLWPVPVNVRMNPFLVSKLMDINATCANEECEIFDFPEYSSQLNPGQLTRLRAFCLEVIRSHDSQSPIAAISIIGHADRALKEPLDRRAKKEQEVSGARANNAQAEFNKMMDDLPGGPRVSAMVHVKTEGVGSKDLAVQHPINDEQMRRNRRIVFRWSRCLLPVPPPKRMPDIPVPTPTDPDKNPNVVFAGKRFMMKIMSGISVGALGGGASYQFLIVDLDNNRTAEYHYTAVIATVGVPPFTECGESSFSNEIKSRKPIQVDQFGSQDCGHDSGSVGLASAMRFSINATDFNALAADMPITMIAGPSKSLGVETSLTGHMTLIPGTIGIYTP